MASSPTIPPPPDDGSLDGRLRHVEIRLSEHEVRLANGVHAFADLRTDAAKEWQDLRLGLAEVKPKPPSVIQVVSVTGGFLVALLGAWWSLSSFIAQRPTFTEVHKSLQEFVPEETRAAQKQLDRLAAQLDALAKDVGDLKAQRKR